MANAKISELPSATLPLGGTEPTPCVQDGSTVQAPASAFGVVQSVTVRITSAELKALNTAPVTIVPAPGAGKAILPVALSASLGGTASYTNTDNPDLYYGAFGSGAQLGLQFFPMTFGCTGFFLPSSTVSVSPWNGEGNLSTTLIANQPLVLADDRVWATGDGELTMTIFYVIVPTA